MSKQALFSPPKIDYNDQWFVKRIQRLTNKKLSGLALRAAYAFGETLTFTFYLFCISIVLDIALFVSRNPDLPLPPFEPHTIYFLNVLRWIMPLMFILSLLWTFFNSLLEWTEREAESDQPSVLVFIGIIGISSVVISVLVYVYGLPIPFISYLTP